MPTITPTRRGRAETFEFRWWAPDVVMTGTAERPIAADTETRLIEGPLDVPEPALGMAYDGKSLVLIHPEDFGAFLIAHRKAHFVFHNLAFDWHVLHEELLRRGEKPAARVLWDIADAGRFHDTMILDQLIQLATGRYRSAFGGYGADTKVYSVGLGTLAEEAGSLDLDKGDQYRLRFGELLGFTKGQMEAHAEWAGFVSYALPDVVSCWEVWPHVRAKAIELMKRAGFKENATRYEIAPTALAKHGPLSEQIQVRGSIALAKLSRTPLPIDQASRRKIEDETREKLKAAFEAVESRNKELLQRHSLKARKYEKGAIKYTAKTGLPAMNDAVLKAVLTEEAHKLGVRPPISPGKKGGISTSAKEWAKYADRSPFVAAWTALEKHAKHLQFLVALDAPNVYAAYNLLMRTGRTSASSHKARKGEKAVPSVNIQQIPRDGDMRALFLAPPDAVYASVDFAFIELRTWAAGCVARFGKSVMGEVIKAGADPHERTAKAVYRLDDEGWSATAPTLRKKYRQNAKVPNFGLLGGLGPTKLVVYAALNFGVDMDEDEARRIKNVWLSTYPEGKLHLADQSANGLAYNLGVSVGVVRAVWPEARNTWHDPLRRIRDTLFNEGTRLSGEDFAALAGLLTNHRPDLLPLLDDRSKWKQLHDELFLYRSCTLTGRVRGRTGYTDGCNCGFQGLASDAGKESVWRLMYAGFDVRAFIHDELVLALPKKSAERDVKRVEEIMVKASGAVWGHGIPSAVESKVGPGWVK